MINARAYSGRWDLLSMAASLLCLVHCVALPLLLSVLPLTGMDGAGWHWLEWVTVAVAVTGGGWAIGNGYVTYHRNGGIVVGFVLGLCLVIGAALAAQVAVEMALKGAGAVLMVWAHLRNRAESRRCCKLTN